MKRTRQRELILENLRGRRDHPTAEEVHRSLRAECPGLSLATVYRNLNYFCEQGLVLRLPAAGRDRFDGNVGPHGHLYCERCGRLFDLHSGAVETFFDRVREEYRCEVRQGAITLLGVCEKCGAEGADG